MTEAIGMSRHKRFRLVGVGGTFDILHRGHKTLLRKALQIGDRVIVGLTSDRFVKQAKKEHEVHPYGVRAAEIRRFLQDEESLGRTEIVPIEDPYGLASTSPDMDALVVSRETFPAAQEINKIRRGLGLPLLELAVVEMTLANNGKPILGRRIRKGEITRTGRILRKRPGCKADSLDTWVLQ